ncbi:PBECR2 nuclease fold domain-containing protein [Chromobacterium sp. ASV23]|uniref:PBECR2 nuclease fold domain-containing protein n=1 Tax=Chromobacterium sp. ASV23 TaxID=2795110 RepID=UPI0018EE43F8|nr:PBECR2 nuclease fold domain-containing protein [Chromobacterium sp. ASV23]
MEEGKMGKSEAKGQPRWNDKGLPDVRDVPDSQRAEPPDMLEQGATSEDALQILCTALGMPEGEDRVSLASPIGPVAVMRDKLPHIVEKRKDGRERYANFAASTVGAPYEVWRVAYDDGSFRLAFIGLFAGRQQLLVVVDVEDDKVLWNMMNCEAKALNKHRHGTLIYSVRGDVAADVQEAPEAA